MKDYFVVKDSQYDWTSNGNLRIVETGQLIDRVSIKYIIRSCERVNGIWVSETCFYFYGKQITREIAVLIKKYHDEKS